MNKQQRKVVSDLQQQLEALKERIAEVANEERDKFDNMPESLQGGERGEKMDSAATALEDSLESLEQAIESLNTALE